MQGLGYNTIKAGLKVLLDNTLIVPSITGHAGIGKTQLVQSIAQEDGYYFKEMTCSLLQEGDLAMPIPDRLEESSSDKMARVKYILHTALVEIIEYHDENPNGKSILFLDEFNRATSSVQSELMNLVLQRDIMGTKLPDGCRVVIAENPSTDVEGYENSEYHVNEKDNAINDRTMRIRMKENLSEWLSDFALQVVNEEGRTKINPLVIEFLDNENDQYFLVTEGTMDKKPTPRAWERVSNFLYGFEDAGLSLTVDSVDNYPFINEGVCGSIGDDVGKLFMEFIRNRMDYIKPVEIVEASESEYKMIKTRLAKMQEIRKDRVVGDLTRYLALKKNVKLIQDEKVIERYLDILLGLDEDTIQSTMLTIWDRYVDDFVDYSELHKQLLDNEDYSDKEFELTVRSNKLSNGIV